MESKNENENQNTNARLDLIKQKCEEECKSVLKRNTFALNLMNEIGKYLDKDFIEFKEFDINDNWSEFQQLFDYFSSLCKKKPEKILALNLISCMVLVTNEITEIYEKIIEDMKKIVFIDGFLNKMEDRIKLMNKLMEEVKLCFNAEQKMLLVNYSKLFEINIILLIEISIYLFSDNINSLLNSIISQLKDAYPNLIVSDTYLSNIENIDINCINNLLTLKFSPNDLNILFFEDSKFQIKNPSNEELAQYYEKEDFEKKKPKKKSKKKKKDNANESQQKIQKIENVSKTQDDTELTLEKLDYNSLCEKVNFLLNENKKNSDQLKKTIEELNETKDELKKNNEKLNETKDELKKNNEKLNETQDELNKNNEELMKMKKNNINLTVRIGNLESELKQIKIRSLYKGIIDGFSFLYNINLNKNYYYKLNLVLDSLEKKYDNNKIVNEFKDFLYDIYYYLERGNYLAHNISDNDAPLELVFSTLKITQKKEYSNVKNILNKLSFNEYLKNALNTFYSLNDESIIKNYINFSLKELESLFNSKEKFN